MASPDQRRGTGRGTVTARNVGIAGLSTARRVDFESLRLRQGLGFWGSSKPIQRQRTAEIGRFPVRDHPARSAHIQPRLGVTTGGIQNRVGDNEVPMLTANLERDVFPALSAFDVADIDETLVTAVLAKVEKRGTSETAHRLRQRISAMFRYAKAKGATKANPAANL